jgi:hypothetical protein
LGLGLNNYGLYLFLEKDTEARYIGQAFDKSSMPFEEELDGK